MRLDQVPDPRYPIGEFSFPQTTTAAQREGWIAEIAEAPSKLRAPVEGLTTVELDTPYRDGGWTVRQVIHHVPESHMNAYIRFKLALTEDEPTIKPYNEAAWARLGDIDATPVETSLVLLEALHERWTRLLRGLDEAAFARTFRHPELGPIRLDQNLALYAWHGRHHIGHVELVRLAR
jgi:hypothetical protein